MKEILAERFGEIRWRQTNTAVKSPNLFPPPAVRPNGSFRGHPAESKKYHSAKKVTEEGWSHEQIELLPLNIAYDPLTVEAHEGAEMVVVGEWLACIE